MKEVGHFLPWVGRLVSHRNSTGTIVDTRNRFPQLAGRTALSIYLVFVFGTVWRSLMMLFWFKMVLEKVVHHQVQQRFLVRQFPRNGFLGVEFVSVSQKMHYNWMNVWETSNFPSIKRGIAIWDDVRWCHVGPPLKGHSRNDEIKPRSFEKNRFFPHDESCQNVMSCYWYHGMSSEDSPANLHRFMSLNWSPPKKRLPKAWLVGNASEKDLRSKPSDRWNIHQTHFPVLRIVTSPFFKENPG